MANQVYRAWIIGKGETEEDAIEIKASYAEYAAGGALERWQDDTCNYDDINGNPVRVAVLDESGKRTTWLARADSSIDYSAEEEETNDE